MYEIYNIPHATFEIKLTIIKCSVIEFPARGILHCDFLDLEFLNIYVRAIASLAKWLLSLEHISFGESILTAKGAFLRSRTTIIILKYQHLCIFYYVHDQNV